MEKEKRKKNCNVHTPDVPVTSVLESTGLAYSHCGDKGMLLSDAT